MNPVVVITEFPKASELNQSLYARVTEQLQYNVQPNAEVFNGIGGRGTQFNLHEQKIAEIDELISWIQHILPEVNKRFATKETIIEAMADEGFGYNLNSFEIAECWGIHYNKTESVLEHNHFPYAISFIYYVRTPEGAAPITIENETYNVKEGQCVFFLATNYHSVGANNCNERCAIVGNILYRF